MCTLSNKLGLTLQEKTRMFPEFSFWDIKKKIDCDIDNTHNEIVALEIDFENRKDCNEETKSAKNTPHDSKHRHRKQQAAIHNFRIEVGPKEEVHYESDGEIFQFDSFVSLIDSKELAHSDEK